MNRGRLVVVLAAILATGAYARAAPLDTETCSKLKVEQAQLENSGVGHNMAKGPEWAKANLAPDKIEQIRRLIELEEQLLFRCTGRSLVNLPPEPEPDPAVAAPADTAEEGKEGPEAEGAPGTKKAAGPKLESDHPKNAPHAAKPPVPAPAKARSQEPKAKGQESKAKQGADAKVSGPASQQSKQGTEGKAAGTPPKQAKQDGTKSSAAAKSVPRAKGEDAFKPPPSGNPAGDPFKQQAPATKQ